MVIYMQKPTKATSAKILVKNIFWRNWWTGSWTGGPVHIFAQPVDRFAVLPNWSTSSVWTDIFLIKRNSFCFQKNVPLSYNVSRQVVSVARNISETFSRMTCHYKSYSTLETFPKLSLKWRVTTSHIICSEHFRDFHCASPSPFKLPVRPDGLTWTKLA